ncbi:hypothetical protein Ccrd_009322 [Cynara cardunculus var. scolymus]|uniref:CRAL-TRIO domain-containing protein n=1 Tax=Cynara cardunculus var. scolymus TaxID=59895 RepID=A0A103YNA3_CYNCS|nr:hypothetical protein Ccrd_009322 [Cynara cardunculus var. scolymus]
MENVTLKRIKKILDAYKRASSGREQRLRVRHTHNLRFDTHSLREQRLRVRPRAEASCSAESRGFEFESSRLPSVRTATSTQPSIGSTQPSVRTATSRVRDSLAIHGHSLRFTQISLLGAMAKVDSNYYPETLHRMFIVNAGPTFKKCLWPAAQKFLDAKTIAKIQDVEIRPTQMDVWAKVAIRSLASEQLDVLVVSMNGQWSNMLVNGGTERIALMFRNSFLSLREKSLQASILRSIAAESATKRAASAIHVTCCTPTCTIGLLVFPSPSTLELITNPLMFDNGLALESFKVSSIQNLPPFLIFIVPSEMGIPLVIPELVTSSNL